MKNRKNAGLRCVMVLTAACLMMGCGSKKKEEAQEKYRQYGITCLENGDYDEAVEAFQKALNQSGGKIQKKEADICFYKAEAQYLNGAYEDALETYNALIEYDQNAEAYYLRGNLYFQMGDSEKAISDFGAAVAQDKGNYELYIGIYESLAAHDMAEEGQYYLNEALNQKGDKAEDHMQKGRISFLLGDTQNAVSLLTEAVEEDYTEANFYLAEVYEALGDKEQADACFQAYLDSGIADSVDLCEMGKRQMENGDYAHAITYFSTGLEMEEVPNRQALMKNMVIAYEKSGDFASARKELESYLELYPSDEDAQREQTFLETR